MLDVVQGLMTIAGVVVIVVAIIYDINRSY